MQNFEGQGQFTIKLLLITVFLTLTVHLFTVMLSSTPIPQGDVKTRMFIKAESSRLSALDLYRRPFSFQPLTKTSRLIKDHYAYLWIIAENPTNQDKTLYFVNRSTNYYTEIMRPAPGGAETLYRQGDIIPLSQSPIKDIRSVFPLSLPAKSTQQWVVEYHGPRSVIVEPYIMEGQPLMEQVVQERSILGIISGIIILLILINLLIGIIAGKTFSLGVALFHTSVFFFFLRQSRLLHIIIDPQAYPEWLFPLSIATNLFSAGFLIHLLLGSFMGRLERAFLRMVGALIIGLTGISFFAFPYEMADALNFMAFPLLLLLLPSLYKCLKERRYEVIWVMITFLPWIVLMIADILASYQAVRVFGFNRYRQGIGLVLHGLLFTGVNLYQVIHKTDSFFPRGQETRKEEFAEVDPRSSLIPSLETIHASARMLTRQYHEASLTAIVQVISQETQRVLSLLETTSEDQPPPKPSLPGQLPREKRAPEDSRRRVWIFDKDLDSLNHTTAILRAEGFSVFSADSRYSVMEGMEKEQIDTLILAADSMGDEAFSLCRILRSDYNLLHLPILLLGNFPSDYLMSKGYAAGVNDFLSHPYSPAELTARIYSLVQLKKLFTNNQDLAQSEKLKNTFLFFLTHNINTPLTILLNRVRDLKNLVSLDELQEISEDLQQSSGEIHEIVQNILISFRLSDGRQPITLEKLDLPFLLETTLKDIRRKAAAKGQEIILELPHHIPEVRVDRNSLRGILYNLMDNAVKYSPPNKPILMRVAAEERINIYVQDSGKGIPPEETSRLFQRFEKLSTRPTAGEGSTGLGLYVSKELAHLNKGDLILTSFKLKPQTAKEEDPPLPGACFLLSLSRIIDRGGI